jgi:glycosyltransferase involved in cell wall biosynthesis
MGLSKLFRLRSKKRQEQGIRFSIIVVCYEMEREIARTLQSISSAYQREIAADEYEVIVVDNGSPSALSERLVSQHGPNFRLMRVENACKAPGAAINQAVAESSGQYIGVVIDGARMLTPGVLRGAKAAFAVSPDAVVATLGFHLGPEHQSVSSLQGYNREMEDGLLQKIDWQTDGYRLFEIACRSGSASFGWDGPIAECNCLFVSRQRYLAIGGYEERFQASGGGLSNHDIYKRACEYESAALYYLVGEGCFHQIHGGVTTGGGEQQVQKFVQLQKEYRDLRGMDYEAPANHPILHGEIPASARWLQASAASENSVPSPASPQIINYLAELGLPYKRSD